MRNSFRNEIGVCIFIYIHRIYFQSSPGRKNSISLKRSRGFSIGERKREILWICARMCTIYMRAYIHILCRSIPAYLACKLTGRQTGRLGRRGSLRRPKADRSKAVEPKKMHSTQLTSTIFQKRPSRYILFSFSFTLCWTPDALLRDLGELDRGDHGWVWHHQPVYDLRGADVAKDLGACLQHQRGLHQAQRRLGQKTQTLM